MGCRRGVPKGRRAWEVRVCRDRRSSGVSGDSQGGTGRCRSLSVSARLCPGGRRSSGEPGSTRRGAGTVLCNLANRFRAAMAQWDRYVRYSFGKTLLGGLFCDDHRIYWNTYGQSTFMWKTISDPWDAQGAKIQRKIRTKWTIHMRKTSVPLNANSSNR